MGEECRLKPTFVIQISFICSRYKTQEGGIYYPHIFVPQPFTARASLSFLIRYGHDHLTGLYVIFSSPNLRFAPFPLMSRQIEVNKLLLNQTFCVNFFLLLFFLGDIDWQI